MQETWVQSLGREHPLELEMATHSSILAWKIPWTEEPEGYSPWGCKDPDMTAHTHTCSPRLSPVQSAEVFQSWPVRVSDSEGATWGHVLWLLKETRHSGYSYKSLTKYQWSKLSLTPSTNISWKSNISWPLPIPLVSYLFARRCIEHRSEQTTSITSVTSCLGFSVWEVGLPAFVALTVTEAPLPHTFCQHQLFLQAWGLLSARKQRQGRMQWFW